jgi:hypothetical protein
MEMQHDRREIQGEHKSNADVKNVTSQKAGTS